MNIENLFISVAEDIRKAISSKHNIKIDKIIVENCSFELIEKKIDREIVYDVKIMGNIDD